MAFRGTIENGRLVLEDGAQLPNGTRVEVSVQRAGPKNKRAKGAPDSLLRLASYAVNTGVRDLAAEHDHYLYGTPKRSKAKTKTRRKSKRRSR